LDGNVESGDVEVLEEDLDHSLSVLFGVSGGFGKEDTLVFSLDSELLFVAMDPDFLHVVPVLDSTVFDGVMEFEDTSFFLGFVSDVAVFLFVGSDDRSLFGISDDGWERALGGLFGFKTGFAHT